MARDEIAEFLETKTKNIEQIWLDGSLKRSIGNEIRMYSGLWQSSIFDVLEYAMSSGDLPICVPPTEAAMWVLYLCEVCEEEEWDELDIEERIANVLAVSIEDGLNVTVDTRVTLTATTLILAHQTLLNICMQNDSKYQFENTITRTTNLMI